MDKIRNFRDLRVWQKAHDLTLEVYRATDRFPRRELYGLTSQMRRAAVSIAANIVEGSARRSCKDLCHFLNMSQGSNEELKYLFILSSDLALLPKESLTRFLEISDHVGAMLYALIRSLGSSS
jgi:four helix bundle protein